MARNYSSLKNHAHDSKPTMWDSRNLRLIKIITAACQQDMHTRTSHTRYVACFHLDGACPADDAGHRTLAFHAHRRVRDARHGMHRATTRAAVSKQVRVLNPSLFAEMLYVLQQLVHCKQAIIVTTIYNKTTKTHSRTIQTLQDEFILDFWQK